LEPNGQITVNIVLYGGTVLYGRTPSFQTDRTCTVLYGVIRYGTVIMVKKAEVRRVLTSLKMTISLQEKAQLFLPPMKNLTKKDKNDCCCWDLTCRIRIRFPPVLYGAHSGFAQTIHTKIRLILRFAVYLVPELEILNLIHIRVWPSLYGLHLQVVHFRLGLNSK